MEGKSQLQNWILKPPLHCSRPFLSSRSFPQWPRFCPLSPVHTHLFALSSCESPLECLPIGVSLVLLSAKIQLKFYKFWEAHPDLYTLLKFPCLWSLRLPIKYRERINSTSFCETSPVSGSARFDRHQGDREGAKGGCRSHKVFLLWTAHPAATAPG